MKYHLVESHLGGYYISKREPEDIEEFCETCGDNDWIVFSFEEENKKEAFIEYFSKRMMSEEEMKEEYQLLKNKQEMEEDIEWSATEDQYMLQNLLENKSFEKTEYQEFLKMIEKNKRKQLELFQKIKEEKNIDPPKKMVYQYYPKNFTT